MVMFLNKAGKPQCKPSMLGCNDFRQRKPLSEERSMHERLETWAIQNHEPLIVPGGYTISPGQ